MQYQLNDLLFKLVSFTVKIVIISQNTQVSDYYIVCELATKNKTKKTNCN